jgi:hypothetical protein
VKSICPNCKTQLTLDTVDGSEITYRCSKCNELLYLSDLIDINEAEQLLLQPPKGVWIKKKKGRIVINVPVTISSNISSILWIFVSLFISLIVFLICISPLIWGFFNIDHDNIITNIINISFGIAGGIFGVLLIFSVLRLYSRPIFIGIKIIFTGNNICIYKYLGGKKENIHTKLIKRISLIKSTKTINRNNAWEYVVYEREINIEIENGNIISISVSNIDEVKSRFLLLILKYFSFLNNDFKWRVMPAVGFRS